MNRSKQTRARTRVFGARGILKAVPVLLMAAGLIQAGPIVYTYTGSGSGTLGATGFTNAAFTVTLTSDTSQVMPQSQLSGEVGIIPIAAQIAIAGLGTSTFTGTTFLIEYQISSNTYALDFGEGNAGLFTPPGNIIELHSTSLYQYDMVSNLTVTGTNTFLSAFVNTNTSGGALSFSSMTPVTFQATLGQGSATPEPGTVFTALFGLAGIGLAGRFRARRSR
jgi:hypothetical protein